MNKRKQLSIQELREKQLEITKKLEQAEHAEQAAIGQEVQRITGLTTWREIDAEWHLIRMADEDSIFKVKDPFHPEATK